MWVGACAKNLVLRWGSFSFLLIWLITLTSGSCFYSNPLLTMLTPCPMSSICVTGIIYSSKLNLGLYINFFVNGLTYHSDLRWFSVFIKLSMFWQVISAFWSVKPKVQYLYFFMYRANSTITFNISWDCFI